MKKKKSKFIPKFFPGDIVYAIAFHTPKEQDEWSKNFLKVFKVKVVDIYITEYIIEYNLLDIPFKEEWGAPVAEEYIFATKEEALKKITKLWKL